MRNRVLRLVARHNGIRCTHVLFPVFWWFSQVIDFSSTSSYSKHHWMHI
uniref:Uncharacterized protein n=1 Tax=Anguilla anguilla TaxID=7936 RepID=A0A0E9X020_ANGAN